MFRLLCVAVIVASCFDSLSTGFLAVRSSASRSTSVRVPRASYDSGKINLGVEIDQVPPPPPPVIECDTSCMTAIMDCVDEGCSVESMLSLDQKLAEDEGKIAKSIGELEQLQKTSYSEDNVGTLAWLKNFLSRSGSLRAQLQTLKSHEDSDFVKQMMKAAAVAFGGGRPNDYPKVGISPFSE